MSTGQRTLCVKDLLHIDVEEAKRAIKAAPIQDVTLDSRASKAAQKRLRKSAFDSSYESSTSRLQCMLTVASYESVPPYDGFAMTRHHRMVFLLITCFARFAGSFPRKPQKTDPAQNELFKRYGNKSVAVARVSRPLRNGRCSPSGSWHGQ